MLVDVTALAQEAGLPITQPETGITSWLESWTPARGQPVSVYFTRRLWEELGGSGPGQTAYHDKASLVLKAAREALAAKVIAQHAWRSWFEAEWEGQRHRLWLIVNHSYSDGIAIGFGPGDFW